MQFWFSAPLNQMENKEVPTELNQISIPVCNCHSTGVRCDQCCKSPSLQALRTAKKTAEFAIHSAEDEAKRIVSEAIKTAEAKKKEAVLEGKDEIHRQRAEAEKELNERRKEVQRQERRIQQKEETLDKKMESLEAKDEILNNKNKQADERLAEAEAVKKSQFEMLERISGFTSRTSERLFDEKSGRRAHARKSGQAHGI